MKVVSKKLIIISTIIFVIIIGILCCVFYINSNRVYHFNVEDYKYGIDYYEYDKKHSKVSLNLVEISSNKYGYIDTAKNAKKIAEQIWKQVYGEVYDSWKTRKPYKVYFDADNKVWMVRGTLPKGYLGGVPWLIIEQETGTILAIWHEK